MIWLLYRIFSWLRVWQNAGARFRLPQGHVPVWRMMRAIGWAAVTILCVNIIENKPFDNARRVIDIKIQIISWKNWKTKKRSTSFICLCWFFLCGRIYSEQFSGLRRFRTVWNCHCPGLRWFSGWNEMEWNDLDFDLVGWRNGLLFLLSYNFPMTAFTTGLTYSTCRASDPILKEKSLPILRFLAASDETRVSTYQCFAELNCCL